MSDLQERIEFLHQSEQRRRSDEVFYRLLRSTQDEPLSSGDWVQVVNAKHGYTATAIEESIEKGYVTIDGNQVVRLTDSGTRWLAEYNERR